MRLALAISISVLLLGAMDSMPSAEARRPRQRPTPKSEPVVELTPELYGIESRALVSVAMDAVAGELDARKHAQGYQITVAVAGGAAAKLGIVVGDVVKSIAGVELSDADAIIAANRAIRDRDWISVELLRGGQPRTLEYYVIDSGIALRRGIESSEDAQYQKLLAIVDSGISGSGAGLRMDRALLALLSRQHILLPPELARQHEKDGVTGLQVLTRKSILNRFGLQTFDLLTHVGVAPVTRISSLAHRFSRAATDDELSLQVYRRGKKLTIKVPLADGLLDAATVDALGAVTKKTKRPTSSADINFAAGIELIKKNHYRIKGSLIDQIAASPMAIARGARIVPSVKNGIANGLKLYAIRPHSLYAKLGLKNGDTVHAINGTDVSAPDKALAVYASLRKIRKITLRLTRRGKPVELFYKISR